MRILAIVALFLSICPAGVSRAPEFLPTEEQVSAHRAEVFQVARDYIVNTFGLNPIDEGKFNPVRFNSTGVWGDFRCRIKELGQDRFEVRGWIRSEGYDGPEVKWTVVVHYKLVDPDAWMYRRIDEDMSNEPKITSWHFGPYRSVPYEAEYSDDFLSRND